LGAASVMTTALPDDLLAEAEQAVTVRWGTLRWKYTVCRQNNDDFRPLANSIDHHGRQVA
jgi:hypothetical protein